MPPLDAATESAAVVLRFIRTSNSESRRGRPVEGKVCTPRVNPAPPIEMKITRILAYRVELPLHETTYRWSGGKSVTVFDSTIVGVETDTGLVGYGKVCPLGRFYLPAYANGVRAGLRELGPHLLG